MTRGRDGDGHALNYMSRPSRCGASARTPAPDVSRAFGCVFIRAADLPQALRRRLHALRCSSRSCSGGAAARPRARRPGVPPVLAQVSSEQRWRRTRRSGSRTQSEFRSAAASRDAGGGDPARARRRCPSWPPATGAPARIERCLRPALHRRRRPARSGPGAVRGASGFGQPLAAPAGAPAPASRRPCSSGASLVLAGVAGGAMARGAAVDARGDPAPAPPRVRPRWTAWPRSWPRSCEPSWPGGARGRGRLPRRDAPAPSAR